MNMKRNVVLALALIALVAVGAFAQKESDFQVTTTPTDVTITKYVGKGAAVEIPTKIQYLPVRTIGEKAFNNNTKITSLTIPNIVTAIGAGAFAGCSKLTKVAFQGPITEFADDAFPGDLRAKFYATNKTKGTAGIYTRPNGTSTTWTKQETTSVRASK